MEAGFKYNMMDLQAAIGIHQLQRVEANWQRRQQIWRRYDQAFAALPVVPPGPARAGHAARLHLYTLLIDEQRTGVTRDAFLEAMTRQNIGVGVHYLSIPEHPYYRETLRLEAGGHAARDADRAADGEPSALGQAHRRGRERRDRGRPPLPRGGMKIWILTSSFPSNPQDARAAAGLFVADFAVALAEAGHEVSVITPDKQPGEKQDPPGVRVHWFRWRGGRKPLSSLKPYLPGDLLAMLSLFRRGARALDAALPTGRAGSRARDVGRSQRNPGDRPQAPPGRARHDLVSRLGHLDARQVSRSFAAC